MHKRAFNFSFTVGKNSAATPGLSSKRIVLHSGKIYVLSRRAASATFPTCTRAREERADLLAKEILEIADAPCKDASASVANRRQRGCVANDHVVSRRLRACATSTVRRRRPRLPRKGQECSCTKPCPGTPRSGQQH